MVIAMPLTSAGAALPRAALMAVRRHSGHPWPAMSELLELEPGKRRVVHVLRASVLGEIVLALWYDFERMFDSI